MKIQVQALVRARAAGRSGRADGEVGLLERLVLVLRRTGAVQQDRIRVQVVSDYGLIVGRRLDERVHVVHRVHVLPQVGQVLWYLELIDEVLAGDSYVLQLGDQLEIEAAHVIAGYEFALALAQMLVDRVQMLQQAQLGLRLVSRQSELEFLVERGRRIVTISERLRSKQLFTVSRKTFPRKPFCQLTL